jgi:hypothetical protein
MTQGELGRQVQEKLQEAAASSYLGQAAIVNKSFVGEFGNDKLLRLTVKLFEAISESLVLLSGEIEDLAGRVAELEGRTPS